MLRRDLGQAPELLRPALTGTQAWKRLENLVVLVHHPDFASAAEAIGCHYATLKSNIRRLEHELGTQLFHRATATRPMRLTDAGQEILDVVTAYRRHIDTDLNRNLVGHAQTSPES